MELEHFSHEHPLILEEEHNNNGVEVSRYVCQQPISGPTYSCRQYLPYSQSAYECSACQQPYESFTYSCFDCNFQLNILCALLVQKIEHICHKHPLTPLQRPTLLLCDACGTRHEGTFYQCTTCRFWVNQNYLLPIGQSALKSGQNILGILLCPYKLLDIKDKLSRGELNIANHPHNLSCVHQPKDISTCDRYGELVQFRSIECTPCNFKLYSDCARNEAMERILSLQLAGELDPVDSGHTS
ncbi:hypothetical protein TEA_003635 [Camellia sinensis var. sinensis]|uniref:DC1 domain-containing protein n=1 Tax=Camellia sinensis var. sinensis TaxID=542762 RepID=A0A4S4E2Y2_CAMSN|nr:hypothetical protein TEA_003635 [Camellia sinensis var. sinensis]